MGINLMLILALSLWERDIFDNNCADYARLDGRMRDFQSIHVNDESSIKHFRNMLVISTERRSPLCFKTPSFVDFTLPIN